MKRNSVIIRISLIFILSALLMTSCGEGGGSETSLHTADSTEESFENTSFEENSKGNDLENALGEESSKEVSESLESEDASKNVSMKDEKEDSNGFVSDKVSDDLFNKATVKGDKFLVLLSLNPISEEKISEKLKETFGYDSYVYDNKELYDKYIVPLITQTVIDKYGKDKAFEVSEEMKNKGGFLTRVDEALTKDYDEYVLTKRNVISDLYKSRYEDFVNEYVLINDDVIYTGQYTGNIVVYATKSEIEKYAAIDIVDEISPFLEEIQEVPD